MLMTIGVSGIRDAMVAFLEPAADEPPKLLAELLEKDMSADR